MIIQKAAYSSSGLVEAGRASVQAKPLRFAVASAMTVLLAVIWCLNHRYLGFSHDAQVYAIQALAKVDTNLSGDLFFQHTSQDQYTIFSRIYAFFIRSFGLADAAVSLMVVFTVWFYVAGWALARNLFDRDKAWLAVVLPMVTIGYYGAFKVFHYSEEFLTARLPAEALVVTALACCAGGRRGWGLLIALFALFVHPLIALPGLLVIIGMWLPLNVTLWGAGFGCLSALALALFAVSYAPAGHLLKVMDPQWTAIVTERSEFLYPQMWLASDWFLNLRGLLCLAVIGTAVENERARRLCVVAILSLIHI